jgi:hypothetical protein
MNDFYAILPMSEDFAARCSGLKSPEFIFLRSNIYD